MKFFGIDKNGNSVYKYILENSYMKLEVLNYGGTIHSLYVKDNDGHFRDVVLGCDNMEDYQNQTGYFGALIGRNSNRIANSKYVIGNEVVKVAKNEGNNQLHGGKIGFDKVIWSIEKYENKLICKHTSPHGDQGYQGNLKVCVKYSLVGGSLKIEYEGESDCDTIFNMTNHTYFNLDSQGDSNVLETSLQIFANQFTPIGDGSIPIGGLTNVENTPFDFRLPKKIGTDINDEDDQIKAGCGYDHNFGVNGDVFSMKKIAVATSEKSGIQLTVHSDLPGVQLYTGNFLNGTNGKGGRIYGERAGFCLETQYYPDAMNQDGFKKPILRRSEKSKTTTVFVFSTK